MPVILVLAAALLVAVGVGGWVAADRLTSDDDGGSAVTATATRTGTATPSTSATPAAAGPTLLYREFGSGADTLWIAPAASPSDRKSVAQIEHVPNWGISASLSPDGSMVAYLALTGESQDAERAEAWVLDVSSGEKRHLADGFDLRTKPVWSPESDSFVLTRAGPQGQIGGEVSLVQVSAADGSEDVLLTEPDVLGLFPIAYSSAPPVGGALVYARLTAGGTDFGWVGAETLLHAVDQSARDYHVSPDGAHVAYLAQQRTDGRLAMRAFVSELGAPETAPVSVAEAPEGTDHFNPVWRDDDTITLGRTPDQGETAAAAFLVSLEESETIENVEPGPDQGFDVPAAWSADGRYLAVRSFEGASAADPGREQLTIVAVGSGREVVGGQGSVEFIGWLAVGPR
jgi:Tol biopolymer transport system component